MLTGCARHFVWLTISFSVALLGRAEVDRNNWVVLVDTSRYWYNYRHVSNVLGYYHTIKRLGVPDSQIILMLADDAACNSRNARPGQIINEARGANLYGDNVEVDYRGDEVSVENFLRLLSGRHTPSTPRSKRLLTDASSNVFIYITGHSGEEFIKFQDWEELTSNDIADAFEQMHKQRRYKKVFWLSDTCQAASLQNEFYTPGIVAMGSSDTKENSYSLHADSEIGAAVVDRFSFYAYKWFQRLTLRSQDSIDTFFKSFSVQMLNSHPQVRHDLYGDLPKNILMTEFLASTGMMHFQNSSLQLLKDTQDGELPGTCESGTASSGTCLRSSVLPRASTRGSAQQSAQRTKRTEGGWSTHWSSSEVLRSAAPLIAALPGLGSGLSAERAISTLGSGEISTHPIRWQVSLEGFKPGVVGWLIGFGAVVCLLGLVL